MILIYSVFNPEQWSAVGNIPAGTFRKPPEVLLIYRFPDVTIQLIPNQSVDVCVWELCFCFALISENFDETDLDLIFHWCFDFS